MNNPEIQLQELGICKDILNTLKKDIASVVKDINTKIKPEKLDTQINTLHDKLYNLILKCQDAEIRLSKLSPYNKKIKKLIDTINFIAIKQRCRNIINALESAKLTTSVNNN